MTRTATIGFEPMHLAVKVLCLTGLGQVALCYLFYSYSLFLFLKFFKITFSWVFLIELSWCALECQNISDVFSGVLQISRSNLRFFSVALQNVCICSAICCKSIMLLLSAMFLLSSIDSHISTVLSINPLAISIDSALFNSSSILTSALQLLFFHSPHICFSLQACGAFYF